MYMNDLPNPSDIVERILNVAKTALPESVSNDVKENVRAAIQNVVSELDVVTREEFEIQKKVLMKTRAKVDELESLLSAKVNSK